MKLVRFKRHWTPYNAGEVAGFPEHIAKQLCSGDRPTAIPYVESDEEAAKAVAAEDAKEAETKAKAKKAAKAKAKAAAKKRKLAKAKAEGEAEGKAEAKAEADAEAKKTTAKE